jgi:hypothetical protein
MVVGCLCSKRQSSILATSTCRLIQGLIMAALRVDWVAVVCIAAHGAQHVCDELNSGPSRSPRTSISSAQEFASEVLDRWTRRTMSARSTQMVSSVYQRAIKTSLRHTLFPYALHFIDAILSSSTSTSVDPS